MHVNYMHVVSKSQENTKDNHVLVYLASSNFCSSQPQARYIKYITMLVMFKVKSFYKTTVVCS